MTALAIAGCSAQQPVQDVAALRVNADSASQRELTNVVSTALGGAPVQLAEDALTTDSTLVVERGMRRQVDRSPERGRDLSRPHRFRLIVDTGRCFLVDEDSGLHWMLADTECVAE